MHWGFIFKVFSSICLGKSAYLNDCKQDLFMDSNINVPSSLETLSLMSIAQCNQSYNDGQNLWTTSADFHSFIFIVWYEWSQDREIIMCCGYRLLGEWMWRWLIQMLSTLLVTIVHELCYFIPLCSSTVGWILRYSIEGAAGQKHSLGLQWFFFGKISL
jgi:hypothetical protein